MPGGAHLHSLAYNRHLLSLWEQSGREVILPISCRSTRWPLEGGAVTSLWNMRCKHLLPASHRTYLARRLDEAWLD